MAPEVGQTLREARTARGIELEEVERITKIRVRYLRAMEEDRWELLPGAAYARGFLATYARYLELDDRALVAEYRRLHEGDAEAQPVPDEMLPRRGVVKAPLIRPRVGLIAGLIAALALGAVIVVAVLGDSDDGGRRSGPAHPRQARGSPSKPAKGERPAPKPDRTSVLLRSTGTVWVCLLGDGDKALVNGETLTTDEARGPFEGRSFEVTFGNGSVELEVDGKPVDVPDAAEPFGYQITPDGVSDLAPSAQPTCT
jgi:cytoskeleton protein RodZ